LATFKYGGEVQNDQIFGLTSSLSIPFATLFQIGVSFQNGNNRKHILKEISKTLKMHFGLFGCKLLEVKAKIKYFRPYWISSPSLKLVRAFKNRIGCRNTIGDENRSRNNISAICDLPPFCNWVIPRQLDRLMSPWVGNFRIDIFRGFYI
jgi:hypothetical protein